MPPTREHADEAEARPDLPDAAPSLAELLVGDRLELVLAGREQHALQADAVLLLLAAACLELQARLAQAEDEGVARSLELREAQESGAGAARGAIGRRDGGTAVREGRDLDVAEVALEPGDLRAEGLAGRALVRRRTDVRGRDVTGARRDVLEQRHLRAGA